MVLFLVRFFFIGILFLSVDLVFHGLLSLIFGRTVESWAHANLRENGLTFLFMTTLLTLLFNAWASRRSNVTRDTVARPTSDVAQSVDARMLVAKYVEHVTERIHTPCMSTPVRNIRAGIAETPEFAARVVPPTLPIRQERVKPIVLPETVERDDGKMPWEREPEEIDMQEFRRRLRSGEIKLEDIRTR